MNKQVFEHKLLSLTSFPAFEHQQAAVLKFGEIISELSGWQLFRINPLRFAFDHGLDHALCVELFIHSVKLGIFDLEWNLICPGCGGIEYSATDVDQLQQELHCLICNIGIQPDADSRIEVAFSLNQSLAETALNPFESFEAYRKFFFSQNFERSPELQRYSHDNFIRFLPLQSESRCKIEFNAAEGCLYRLLSMVSHSEMYLRVRAHGASDAEIDIGPNGFMVKEVDIAPGPIRLNVFNCSGRANAATLLKTDFDLLHEILEKHPNQRYPFLTAKMLLNNQSFRDLFSLRVKSWNLSLNVQSLSILFTDLRGSTALYESVGDFRAYQIVQEHFKALTKIIKQHSGALVKTIGDAMMASFSTPQDALRAALAMVAEIDQLSSRTAEWPLRIKVGIHEGPALVINANERLDYFGQTVNTAWRIQELARAGEIVLSEPVMQAQGIAEILQSCSTRTSEELAELRGINRSRKVFRCAV